MRLFLERIISSDKQTVGILYLLSVDDSVIDTWYTLELPDLDNKRYISRIPEGSYKCKKHKSPKFGKSLWLQDVPNRSEILIHKGNYHTDILGCIIIGTDIRDINHDFYMDVINSKNAMDYLLNYLEDIDGIMIEIV